MLRRSNPRDEPKTARTVVLCAVAGRRVAVPPARIVEVARVGSYTPVPCDDAANLGVVLHRDRVIPLVDLAPRLGVRRAAPVPLPGLCLVVTTDLGEVGFPIEQVLGFAPVSDGRAPDGVTLLDPDEFGGSHAKGTPD